MQRYEFHCGELRPRLDGHWVEYPDYAEQERKTQLLIDAIQNMSLKLGMIRDVEIDGPTALMLCEDMIEVYGV